LGRVVAEAGDQPAHLLGLLVPRERVGEHELLVDLTQHQGLGEAGDVGLGHDFERYTLSGSRNVPKNTAPTPKITISRERNRCPRTPTASPTSMRVTYGLGSAPNSGVGSGTQLARSAVACRMRPGVSRTGSARVG